MELKEIESEIAVPRNTGLPGLLRAIEQIAARPRVQSISINSKGVIKYKHYVPDDSEEYKNFGVDFEDLRPYSVIRNTEIVELDVGSTPPPASTVIGMLFDSVLLRQMRPINFVVGVATQLWSWYQDSTGHAMQVKSHLHGLGVLIDQEIPDTALILCAGFGKDAALIDTQVAFKIEIPMGIFHTPELVPQ